MGSFVVFFGNFFDRKRQKLSGNAPEPAQLRAHTRWEMLCATKSSKGRRHELRDGLRDLRIKSVN